MITAVTNPLRPAAQVILVMLLLCLALPGCKKEIPQENSARSDSETAPLAEPASPAVPVPPAEPGTFAMEEFSVFDADKTGPLDYQLTSGQSADETADKPYEAIKASPSIKSEAPVYGRITFGDYLFDTEDNVTYYFAIDESQGTGKGYDVLYFDVNHDLDLTNDAAVKSLAESPTGGQDENEAWFETLEFTLTTPSGRSAPLKLVPRMRTFSPGNHYISFVVPTARRGKIKIGDKEIEAKLAQGIVISGRFDRPSTTLTLEDTNVAIPFLGAMRKFGDTLYEFSATPEGDELTVKPYTGGYGVFKAADADTKIVMGYLIGKKTVVDLKECPEKDGHWVVPVDDYRPAQLAVDAKDVRYGVSAQFTPPGQEPSMPAVFGIKISRDKPFELAITGQLKVNFNSPTDDQRYKPGDTVRVDAMMYAADMGVMLSGVEDKSKPEGDEMTMPDGTKMQRYASIDPDVKIVDSTGKMVAEGKMPFG